MKPRGSQIYLVDLKLVFSPLTHKFVVFYISVLLTRVAYYFISIVVEKVFGALQIYSVFAFSKITLEGLMVFFSNN